MKNIDENFFHDKSDNAGVNVEQLFSSDEKLLWKGCPKKLAYILSKTMGIMPFALIWLLFDGGVLAGIIFGGVLEEAGSQILLFIIPFFALHLTPVWIWLGSTIKAAKEMNNIKYYITNKRIFEVAGKIPYIKSQVKVQDITKCLIKKSFADTVLKVSDIYITAKSSIVLFDIPNGEFICAKIDQLVQSVKKNIQEEAENREFYKNSSVCEHCDSICDASLPRCPNCGAGLRRH